MHLLPVVHSYARWSLLSLNLQLKIGHLIRDPAMFGTSKSDLGFLLQENIRDKGREEEGDTRRKGGTDEKNENP